MRIISFYLRIKTRRDQCELLKDFEQIAHDDERMQLHKRNGRASAINKAH
jgi:hypothetical protein